MMTIEESGLWDNGRPLHLPVECTCKKQYLAQVILSENQVYVDECPGCGKIVDLQLTAKDLPDTAVETGSCSGQVTWRASGQRFQEATFHISETASACELVLDTVRSAEAFFAGDNPGLLTWNVVAEIFRSWPADLRYLLCKDSDEDIVGSK